MFKTTLNLPDDLKQRIERASKQAGISFTRFMQSAAIEKLAASQKLDPLFDFDLVARPASRRRSGGDIDRIVYGDLTRSKDKKDRR